MHPLIGNLSELKDEELQKKYQELSSKLNTAYRFGNHQVIWQMQMLLEDYRTELNNRQQKLNDAKQDKHNLHNLIKVK